jgi:hypothetical protein
VAALAVQGAVVVDGLPQHATQCRLNPCCQPAIPLMLRPAGRPAHTGACHRGSCSIAHVTSGCLMLEATPGRQGPQI